MMATDIYTRNFVNPSTLRNTCFDDCTRWEFVPSTVSQVGFIFAYPCLFDTLLIKPMFSGDYNLTALDYLDKAGLQWIGNCNELNAGM